MFAYVVWIVCIYGWILGLIPKNVVWIGDARSFVYDLGWVDCSEVWCVDCWRLLYYVFVGF